MTRTPLIRTTAAVETPAAGHWPLGVAPTVTIAWSRRGAGDRIGDVTGTLIAGDAPLDLRIVMSMQLDDGSSDPDTLVELDVAFVDGTPAGHWTFVGDVAIAGRRAPATVVATYRGVFQRGQRAWTELSFHAYVGRGSWRRRRLTIDADVIFDAPDSVGMRSAA